MSVTLNHFNSEELSTFPLPMYECQLRTKGSSIGSLVKLNRDPGERRRRAKCAEYLKPLPQMAKYFPVVQMTTSL